jgi:NADH-quinone oxidoreductase subunit F
MNRNEMESDPHALIEGMAIGAFAMGATEGIIYCRAEYPLAVMRLKRAIEDARGLGLLGNAILGTPFSFDIEVVEGAGAFVCGEETALIASLEGRAGRPRNRPPFPSERGLWGFPTNINNVETWYSVVPIMTKGADWFTQTGTKSSTGTKVFSLVGKVKNTGLVELPLGEPIKHIVYSIGGGTGTSKKVKAVQTGGPSGGCIPAELFDCAVDYESLAAIGAIMGSGGMVVMDEDNCMVDVARYFVEFTRDESCGKCVPCRAGMDQALYILREITEGRANPSDIERLEQLANMVRDTSLCGLGQNAPNPVLTTLKYFRDEYDQHVVGRRCLPTACESLFVSPCENSCPVHMNIPGYLELVHEGREEEALELVVLDNPLASITGRVCQHPCESRCRRAGTDAAVSIREVHRYLADRMDNPEAERRIEAALLARRLPETGKRVAIVGSGPAGLTAAFYLALTGHAVTVLESKPEPGGMLRYALPEYRLPKTVVERDIGMIGRLGVEFRCNTKVGVDVSLVELEATYDAVFLAIGTWQESALGIPGSDLPSVTSSLEFLDGVASGTARRIGKRVAVVGGGNSAIDSARTALRLGADEVRVVYRRERSDMPAILEETEAAEHEGVRFSFMSIPRRILGAPGNAVTGIEVQRARMSGFDAFGRRVPEPTDEMEIIPCDSVIVAVGEKVDGDVIRRIGVKTVKGDRAAVEPFTLRTARPRVWAGGDLVTGPFNVVTAMGQGKVAADQIDRELMGSSRVGQMRSTARYENRVPLEPEGGPRNAPIERPLREHRGSFDEVSLGLAREAVRCEASRCLRCDVKAEAAVEEEAR